MRFSLRSSVAALLALTSVLGTGCTNRGGTAREDDATECANGVDDDDDGMVDCAETACAVHVSCGGSGSDAGTDGGGGPGADVGPVDAAPFDAPPRECVDPIDVVFVLDVSTSMAMEAARLREGIGSIFAAADALTPDHRFGLVVFVDDELVVSGCNSFPTAENLQDEFDRWRVFCATNENPDGSGSNGDCAENSLDALHAAALECQWRDGATHVLIHVTDDTFEEPPYRYSGDIPAEHDYAEVVAALTTRQIRVGAFAMEHPEDCGAGTSSDTARGFFTPYEGMDSLPVATGGEVWSMADVRAGTLDMDAAISALIERSHCNTVF
jgi:hypothetical protein